MDREPVDYSVQLPHMEASLQELKKLVSTGWTYAVIWRIGPDHRAPLWHQSYFSDTEAAAGQAQQFESIYRHCQFTPSRPGYAYLAWQQQSPLWWTSLMKPVLTDQHKELFLRQAGIQTLVCFPGCVADGRGFCVELATTSLRLKAVTDIWEVSDGFQRLNVRPIDGCDPLFLPAEDLPHTL